MDSVRTAHAELQPGGLSSDNTDGPWRETSETGRPAAGGDGPENHGGILLAAAMKKSGTFSLMACHRGLKHLIFRSTL